MRVRKLAGLVMAVTGLAMTVWSVAATPAGAGQPAGNTVTPGGGIDSHNSDGWATDCDSTEWHWVITGLSVADGTSLDAADVPATITVTWSDGDETQIALGPNPTIAGSVAHYFYYGHLDGLAHPTSATATFPNPTDVESYNQFNLSHGLCDPGTEPPTCEEDPTQEGCEETCETNPEMEGCEETCETNPEMEGCEETCETNPEMEGCEETCETNPEMEGCEETCETNPLLPECFVPTFTIAPYCKVVDVDGKVVKEWFTLTNPNGISVDADWADGDMTLAPAESAKVATGGPGIDVTLEGFQPVFSEDSPSDICTRTVEFTKDVEGAQSDETYTIRVSRLVPPAYIEETTFDIANGETVTLDLPSTGDDDGGFTYMIEETDDGGAAMHTITPGEITLDGHLGETVSVVIVNSYASIELDKQVSDTTVTAGQEISYTLQAHNTGALALEDVVISDLLPVDVTLSSWEIQDDGGTCTVVQDSQPQLISCELDDVLPVDGFTKVITLNVVVDADVPVDTVLLNQAKVIGFYIAPAELAGGRTELVQPVTALSCTPIADGAVCDLSAQVGSTVVTDVTTTTDQGSGGATTTTTGSGSGGLPQTGSNSSWTLLVVGLLMAAAGALFMVLSRRTARN